MEKLGGNYNGMNSDHKEHDKRTRVKNGMDWESTIVLDKQRK